MMNFLKNDLTVPLTLVAHQFAQQFYHKHSDWQKAKQVYLNALAVYAMEFYLRCLGIETDRQVRESWNPAIQTLANTADLEVKNLGKLECRPVLPDAQICQVPPEVWSNRIGYVAVRLDRTLTQATLLGFVPTVNREEVPLSELKPLEELLEHLDKLKQPEQERAILSSWLHNLFETGWETVETLFGLSQVELAFNFRSQTSVKRGKWLSLERFGEEVVLCVGLLPEPSSKMNISVEVYPQKGQSYLPQDLQLMVLDESGEAVMQAIAKSTEMIQLNFRGESGERFSVKVALGDVSVTEAFLI
ncbi:MAG TPA: DUF1822 family protein [Coleofasciculaceae cyanobacterium]